MSRALLCVLLVAGCGARTEVVVSVDPQSAFNSTTKAFTGGPSDDIMGTVNEICFDLSDVAAPEGDPTWNPVLPTPSCGLFQLGVVPRGDWSGQTFDVRVRGTSSCTAVNAPFLYALGQASFVEGHVVTLQLGFTRACAADEANPVDPTACPVIDDTTPYIAPAPCE